MDNGQQLNSSNVMFDEDGMKVLAKCKHCGGEFWMRQGKVFKKWLHGSCPSCGYGTFAKMGIRRIEKDENGEKPEPFKDEDFIIFYLREKSYEEVDPILLAAADMIRNLSDKHWNECLQIAKYDDELMNVKGRENGNADEEV